MIGHSDAPIQAIDEDTLGLSADARSLAEFAVHCCTPMTIAIQGDWGTGKTSLLRMIECELKPKVAISKIATIKFETWQYAQFGSSAALPVSLLSLFLRRLSPEGAAQKAVNVLRKLARPVGNAAIRVATFGASELGDFSGPPEPVDYAEENEQLRVDIEEAVNKKLAEGYDRIVVFIDDLDRIEAEKAVEILETIKMFLDCKGCVFFLALDYAVVREGVRKKFGIEDEQKSRSFFDKIIQLPFNVPVGRYDSSAFIRDLLNDMKIDELEDDHELLVELTKGSVSTNPRSIKRVFNSFQLQLILGKQKLSEHGEDKGHALRILFGLLCLQSRFPAVYGWLLDQESVNADVLGRLRLDDVSSDQLVEENADGIPLLDGTEDQKAFRRFSSSLIKSLQISGEDLDDINDVELARINSILQLTRTTAVSEGSHKATNCNKKFQASNREMMAKTAQNIMESLADKDIRLKSYCPSESEEVRLYWTVPTLGVGVALGQSIDFLRLWIFGSKNKLGIALPILREKLPEVGWPDRIGPADKEITVWEMPVSAETSLEDRQQRLADVGQSLYAKIVSGLATSE